MEYDTKASRRSLLGISMRVILALVLAGLLVAPIAVQADLQVTAVVYAWDFNQDKFQPANLVIPWDGTWIPFLHVLNFDDDIWVEPGAPPMDKPTWLAGNMYYGLYHEDTPDPDGDPYSDPQAPPGFQESRLWSLVDCDRNNDDKFGPGDLGTFLSPYDQGLVYADCLPSASGGTHCIVEPAEKDVPTICTTGNCSWEIVTTIRVNLDLDGDQAVDDDLLAKGLTVDRNGEPELLCFYAQARTPTPDLQVLWGQWSIPLQARISDVGGDATVTFSIEKITAVELAAFDAAAQDNGVMLTWETATELDNLGFNIYRADSQVGEMNKINLSLIPSKDPGSTVGAAYSFLDESAVAGATYYYWLEDVDVSGAAEMNGPVAAKMSAARSLPGRGRPAPMPANAY